MYQVVSSIAGFVLHMIIITMGVAGRVIGIARVIATTLLGPTCSPGSRAGLILRAFARAARGGGDWWMEVEEEVCGVGDPALGPSSPSSLHLKVHTTNPSPPPLPHPTVSMAGS